MTSAAPVLAPGHDAEVSSPAVEIVVPVLNEERVLAASVRRLHGYLTASFPYSFRITIADNGSTDGTWQVAQALHQQLGNVAAIRLPLPGRGRALSTVWSESDAAVLAYMDVDLSTGLTAFLPLVAPLLSGHSDLAIGTRLGRGARVERGPKRELISRAYNLILRTVLRARFSDAQCGFKAIRADRAQELLPQVRDRAWFFDTELLVLAQRRGLRIHEVPVDWTDDPDSRVDVVGTAAADLRGVWRLLRHRESTAPSFNAQVARFAAVGVASTAAYALLYLALRPLLAAQGANALALLLTAVTNTAANRRWTFSIRGRSRAATQQAQGLVVFGLALALTSGAIAALRAFDPDAGHAFELAVLTAANLAATVLRFVLLRVWVFRSRRRAPAHRPRGGLVPMSSATWESVRGRALVRRTGWERPALARAARGDGRPLPVGPRRERLGERLLRRGGAGGDEELEGVLLRLVRLVELHHRRQAARLAVGDGALGAGLRAQLVEHARAAGARGRRGRRAPLRDGEAPFRRPARACSRARCWR